MTTENNPLAQKLIPRQRYITLAMAGLPPIASPGVCKITGAGRPLKFDEQEGYGMDGGWLKFHGTKFVHFEVEIQIWEDAHWLQWQLFSLLLAPPPKVLGVPAITLGIEHPILKDVGIDKVYCEDPGQWTLVSETGKWSRSIKFIKWVRGLPRENPALEGPPAIGVAAVPLTAQQKINATLDAENAALRAKAAG